MIREYHRPETIEEALTLLSHPQALPLGGGTSLSQNQPPAARLVDLQSLGLDTLTRKGSRLHAGATVRLQDLLKALPDIPALAAALCLEVPLNLRNMRTLAGALLRADGRSPLAAVIMALDVSVQRIRFAQDGTPQPEERLPAGDWLLQRHTHAEMRQLVLGFSIPLNVRLGFEYVARTPGDRPLLCAAVAQWPSGRTRLVLGGWGTSPSLAMDGPDATGLPAAARNTCYEAADPFASAEYRREVAPTLARRALADMEE